MARSSKELAKRLRFLRIPQPDFFRSRYWLVGLAATAAGFGLWLLLSLVVRERQFLPGPVSQNHATFGDRCEACHSSFASVRDEACLVCHTGRIHSDLEVGTPKCRDCHVEHRNAEASPYGWIVGHSLPELPGHFRRRRQNVTVRLGQVV